MVPNIMNGVRKPGRLLAVVAVAMALLFVALPTYAATPVAKGAQPPDATCPAGGQCFADVPAGNSFYEFVNRIYEQDLVSGYPCGGTGEPCDADNRPYYRPAGVVTRQQMAKFIDNARRLPQINIQGTDSDALIYADNSIGHGVYGESTSGTGVFGESTSGDGVHGRSNTGWGVWGESTSGSGVWGRSTSLSAYGVFGDSPSGTGVFGLSTSGWGVYGYSASSYGVYGSSASSYAGYFGGDIYVGGSCTGCAGPTRIDHPLDPENKYLYHSTVQSPDMKNVYDGVVTLDANGEAEVVLPEWFEALNKEFRYQLTTIGGFAPVYIAEEVSGNRFKIAGGSAQMKVSWQLTGVRHDPYAEAHRANVEEEKPAEERGKYVHPTEWGQPELAGIDYEEQQKMQETMQQAGER